MASCNHAYPVAAPPYGPLILVLDGTITTNYRGNAYQTPLLIFIPPQYPYVPPTVQLNPSQGMTFDRNCPHIDPNNGRVIHPCVNAGWRPGVTTLVESVYLLASLFGDGGVPPLRAADARPAIPLAQPQAYGYNTGPSPSGYPPGQSSGTFAQPGPGGAGPRPGYVQAPPINAQFNHNHYNYPAPQQQHGYGQSYGTAHNAATAAGSAASASAAAALGPRPSHAQYGQAALTTPAHVMSRQQSDMDIRGELKQAVTQRLQSRLRKEYDRLSGEAEEVSARGDRISERGRTARALHAQLEERKQQLEAYSKEVRERTEATKAWLADYDAAQSNSAGSRAAASGITGDVDIDDGASDRSGGRGTGSQAGGARTPAGRTGRDGSRLMFGSDPQDALSLVYPVTPLQRQALRVVSEDIAYEDYLPHVDEALLGKRIGPTEAVAEVREVARKQWQARALGRKIDRALEQAGKARLDLERQYGQGLQVGSKGEGTPVAAGWPSPTVAAAEQMQTMTMGPPPAYRR